jgi:hypothetical protein
MPFTKFTNLDFDQIKESIRDYLRANSNFTDYDFEGSNFSVLIDTLAYNTYITAFNSNMAVNESFLDSATVRENVVSLARNIGYVPRSKTCAKATVSFTIQTSSTEGQLTLKSGLVCVGNVDNTSYVFSIPQNITTSINNGEARFSDIEVYQGVLLNKQFVVDNTINQRFILDNSNIDTDTLVVIVGTRQYRKIDNILNLDGSSEIYLIQEIADEKYEILFGDGILGKKLTHGETIKISYITTDGKEGNGPSLFSYSGTTVDSLDRFVSPTNTVTIETIVKASNGGDIEPIESIKYFAPRVYSSQYRAVTAIDYEAIIQKIYSDTESVSVVGGEELNPPQYGNVLISIKPKNGISISDFTKSRILTELKKYSVSGINQQIIDLKLLYVEIESYIYYNTSLSSNANDVRTKILNTLEKYSKTIDLNKFGGRFKYSKVLQLIDNVDSSITSNITRVKMRRNMNCVLNTFAQYEICFGNQFHKNIGGYTIKSTGFNIVGEPDMVYFVDVPNPDSNIGTLSIVKPNEELNNYQVVKKSIGTVDYTKGEIIINTINVLSTELDGGIIEIQAYPESNDIIGLKDLYLVFDTSKSTINMVKDTISSGDKLSGIDFLVTSSYSNGKITR